MSEIRLRRPHVLYLDSDPEQAAAFSYALLDHAEVFTANSVAVAWQLLGMHSIAIIVVDLDLAFGQDDNEDFLTRVQPPITLLPTVNIVVATSFRNPDLIVRALNSGMVWRIYEKTSEEYLGDGRLPEIVREASQEQARRYVAQAVPEASLVVLRRIVQTLEMGKRDKDVACREAICRMIAPEMDISDRERELLPVAAVLHGLSALTTVETTAQMLSELPVASSPLPLIAHILYGMEARFDGQGRNPLAGGRIHVLARVLAVVCQFDFLMRDPFGETNKIDAALARVEAQSGGAYDPEVVKAFASIVRRNRKKVEEMYRLAN